MPLAVLSALAKPTRLGAMAILADGGEHCVCELMARLEATQSRMSRHMKVLKLAGLVVDRRDAQWVRYRLNPDLAPGLGAIVTAAPAAAAQDSPERKVAWVPKPKPPTAAPEGDLPQERLGMVDRLKIGLDQVREIVGRVWIRVVIGISIGALIHGYVPEAVMLRIMGGDLRRAKRTFTKSIAAQDLVGWLILGAVARDDDRLVKLALLGGGVELQQSGPDHGRGWGA